MVNGPVRNLALRVGGSLLIAASLALPLYAQNDPAAQERGAEASEAERVLIDQARYWVERGRADLAERALNRLLEADPTNAEALLHYGLLEVERDNIPAAQQRLQELRRAHPGDTARIQRLETAVRAGRIDPAELERARRFAREGLYERAIQEYRRTFDGPPPEQYSLEYYETLGGSSEGRPQAIRGLREMAERTGRDPRVMLALGRILTYDEGTRREGIGILEELSRAPQVRDQATTAWREALTWLGPDPRNRPLFDRYLQRFPDDRQILAKIDEIREVAVAARPAPPDRFALARIRGFELLDQGDLDGAAERFRFVLQSRPNDADALGGLGTIHLREGRIREARDLLARAVRISRPAARRWGEAHDSAQFWAGMGEAEEARDAGRLADAERILTDLVRRGTGEPLLARVMLGDVLYRRDRIDAAEEQYAAARRLDPSNMDAVIGLFNVYAAQGRSDEALDLADRIAPDPRRVFVGYDAVLARVLRVQAAELARVGEVDRAFDAFQQAIAADPADPWIRVEFARFLVRHGDVEQAHNLIDPLVLDDRPTLDQLHAAAVFYDELSMHADALYVLDRIPEQRYTADMRELRQRVHFNAEVARAQALAEAGQEREAQRILEGLYRTTPQTPDNVGVIAGSLAGLGRHGDALRMTRRSVIQSGEDDTATDAQLRYLGILVQAGHEAEAAALMRQFRKRTDLTAAQMRDLRGNEIGLAVQQADRSRSRGNFADAYDILYPHLAESPDDATLLLALARVYATAKYHREAQIIYATVLERDPANLDAIRGAVGAAIEAKDMETAAALLDQGLHFHPNEPRLYFLIGEVAKAQGDTRTAVRALETAQQLRREQLEARAAAAPPLVPDLPPNPFRGVGGHGAGLPVPQTVQPPHRPLFDHTNPFGSSSVAPPPDAREPALMVSRVIPADRAGEAGQLLASADGGFVADAPPPLIVRRAETGGRSAPELQTAQASEVYIPSFVDPAIRRRQDDDNLTRDIDRSLSEIRRTTAPFFQIGAQVRTRSGDSGLDRLTELTIPTKVSYSPSEFGTLTLNVVPTFVSAGSISADPNQLRRFGTNVTDGPNEVDPGNQSDFGMGVGLGFEIDDFSLDFGTSPLGFRILNFVGGIGYAPRLSETAGLRFTLERRAVTDSLLSYAGAKDAKTGKVWGGVTRTGGRIDIDMDFGRMGAYAGAGAYVYQGTAVESNQMFEAGIGAFYRLIDMPDQELKIGANFTFFGFDKNRRHFTEGHGGYFSPQTFTSFAVPVEYVKEMGPYSILVGGAIGISHFVEDRVAYFPDNPSLQARAAAHRAADPSVRIFYDGQSKTGVGFNLHGQLEYQVDTDLAVGTGAAFDSAADWFEGTAMLYLKRTFGEPGPRRR